MNKVQLRKPFFVVNPKSYLYGKDSLALAKHADNLAGKLDLDIMFTGQLIDLAEIAKSTKNLIITAQHMDGLVPGRGMGMVLPEGLAAAGVKATFLNHAEHPMTINQLARAISRADELGILTIACADSVDEASAIAQLHPDVMVCEPTSLIGTGKVSDSNYMDSTNKAVKSVSPQTKVLQAAGISTGKNVYDAIKSGADGSGATSGIVAAKDPFAILEEMLTSLAQIRDEMK